MHGSKNTLLVLFEISKGTSLAARRVRTMLLPAPRPSAAGRARAEDHSEHCFFELVARRVINHRRRVRLRCQIFAGYR
jgi:hypothetical protein